jgi:hypothetical protein
VQEQQARPPPLAALEHTIQPFHVRPGATKRAATGKAGSGRSRGIKGVAADGTTGAGPVTRHQSR